MKNRTETIRKRVSYLDMHLIPKDRELWNLDKSGQFVEERKHLIEYKFDYLIVKDG